MSDFPVNSSGELGGEGLEALGYSPSPIASGLSPVLDDCWKRIGVAGDHRSDSKWFVLLWLY